MMEPVTPEAISELTQATGAAPQTSGPAFSIDPMYADQLFQQGKINQDTLNMVKSRMPAAAPQPEKLPTVSVQAAAPAPQERTDQIDPLTRAQIRNQLDLGQANALQRQGIGMQAAAAGQQARAADQIYNKSMQDLERVEMQRKAKELEQKEVLDKSLKDYERFTKEAADFKVDPNRFYGSLNTGQKIGLGIAAVLAGFAGGDNKVVQMIERSVNKDIDLQKDDYERKLASGKQAQNAYSMMRDKFQDDKSADLAARASILERMKLQLENEAVKYQGAEAQGKFKMALGMLDSQIATARQEFLKRQEERAALGQVYGIGDQSSPDSKRVDALIMNPALSDAQREKLAERRVKGPGYDFIARNDGLAKMANEFTMDGNGVIEMISDIKKLSKESGLQDMIPLTERRMRVESIRKMLAGMLNKSVTGGGPLNQEDYKRLLELVPNPVELTTFQGIERLSQLESGIRTKMKSAIETAGGKYYGKVDFSTERVK